MAGSVACDDTRLSAVPDNGPSGDGPPGTVPPDEPPDTPPTVADCQAAAETRSFTLGFQPRRGCVFSSEGNLPPRNEFVQARADEVRFVQLPQIRTLCDLTLRAREGPPIFFDDHVAIVVEDVVLVSGGSGLALNEYETVDGLPRFDWSAVRGEPFRPRNSAYACLGGGRCDVPRTERFGDLNVEVGSETMIAIANSLSLNGGFNVRFLTFGDNDASDCAHSELTLDVDVRYLP